jgi:beta-galactosidase
MEEPFIYGAQYYRAPTPEPECWAGDLARMRELGFNAVKFWVQWRWSEPSEGVYDWSDLDSLMDLAKANSLAVTLNIILDVAPVWLFGKFPDSKMVDASGRVLEPRANICRQIGGYPGPCYNHPGALAARRRFVEAAVAHFAPHPALSMWDVWSEPEHDLSSRSPNAENLFCHCPECRKGFIPWLRHRYADDLTRLNRVWGRRYGAWDEVEAPLRPETISDFIDWREFHLDKLSGEAKWRLDSVAKLDPVHTRYLHVVANSVDCFNAVSCVDDFELARECQVFGSTMMSSPLFCAQALSAAQGRTFYNAECHIDYGSTAMHQRIVDRSLFLKEIIPQIGWGVRGFLFWQFRAETLGMESPAWGLVRPDASARPVTLAAEDFGRRLLPLAPRLMACPPERPSIGLWRSLRNELFQFSIGQLKNYGESLKNLAALLYRLNLPFRTLADRRLRAGALDGLKVLVMPDAYFLDEEDASSIDAWLRAGGVLIADAHLGGYDGTTGRHSRSLPGCGLGDSWGLRELDSCSSFHLPLAAGDDAMALSGAGGDVAKALSATGASGSEFFPLDEVDGAAKFTGGAALAILGGEDFRALASFRGSPCVASKRVGDGMRSTPGRPWDWLAKKTIRFPSACFWTPSGASDREDERKRKRPCRPPAF